MGHVFSLYTLMLEIGRKLRIDIVAISSLAVFVLGSCAPLNTTAEC